MEVSHELGGAEGEATEVEGVLQQEEAPVAERGDAGEEVQQPTSSPSLPSRRTTQAKRGAVRGGAKEGAAKERPKRAAHPRDFLKYERLGGPKALLVQEEEDDEKGAEGEMEQIWAVAASAMAAAGRQQLRLGRAALGSVQGSAGQCAGQRWQRPGKAGHRWAACKAGQCWAACRAVLAAARQGRAALGRAVQGAGVGRAGHLRGQGRALARGAGRAGHVARWQGNPLRLCGGAANGARTGQQMVRVRGS
ncbi:unnamed protein product [Closterium sp. NIES-64]|nr:unnamed protein product [Closterium sp. NIES-64]CAI5994984.1 unnamed protein product [Closterium sp. NIES-64]